MNGLLCLTGHIKLDTFSVPVLEPDAGLHLKLLWKLVCTHIGS